MYFTFPYNIYLKGECVKALEIISLEHFVELFKYQFTMN